MPVGVGDEKIVCAGKVVVEPRVDFYPALRASEFRPAEVVHVKADCRRVDEFRALLLPTSPASGEFVVPEQVEIKFLEHLAGALFICVRRFVLVICLLATAWYRSLSIAIVSSIVRSPFSSVNCATIIA